jgi:hypothetical protein
MRFLFSLLFLLACSNAIAAESHWRWVKATNNVLRGWDVSEGTADVLIKGERFNAELFLKDSDKDVKLSLHGTIKNGKVSVIETIHESDAGESTYKGTFQRKQWKEFSGPVGAESITLSDGWGMIGITRSIKK